MWSTFLCVLFYQFLVLVLSYMTDFVFFLSGRKYAGHPFDYLVFIYRVAFRLGTNADGTVKSERKTQGDIHNNMT